MYFWRSLSECNTDLVNSWSTADILQKYTLFISARNVSFQSLISYCCFYTRQNLTNFVFLELFLFVISYLTVSQFKDVINCKAIFFWILFLLQVSFVIFFVRKIDWSFRYDYRLFWLTAFLKRCDLYQKMTHNICFPQKLSLH